MMIFTVLSLGPTQIIWVKPKEFEFSSMKSFHDKDGSWIEGLINPKQMFKQSYSAEKKNLQDWLWLYNFLGEEYESER